jgi:hypothetical protein
VNRRQDDVKIRSIGVEIASRRWRQRRYRRFLGRDARPSAATVKESRC